MSAVTFWFVVVPVGFVVLSALFGERKGRKDSLNSMPLNNNWPFSWIHPDED